MKPTQVYMISSGSFLESGCLEYTITNFKERNEARKSALLVKFGKAKFANDYDRELAYNLVKAQFGRLWQNTDFDNISSICTILSKDPSNEAQRR